jgi:hypothetical protein
VSGSEHTVPPDDSPPSGPPGGAWAAREAIKLDGRWDPTLDAYVVEIDGRLHYYAWRRPWLVFEAFGWALITLFWVGVAALILSMFFTYPNGVAGDRRAQLAQALQDTYGVEADYLPGTWSGTQVFTVDIKQRWDDPDYDEPPVETEGCRLQPGATSSDLSLQCPHSSGGRFTEVRKGGLNARQDREHKQSLEQLERPAPGGRQYDSLDDYLSDLHDDYEPPDQYLYDRLDDYEPEIYP